MNPYIEAINTYLAEICQNPAVEMSDHFWICCTAATASTIFWKLLK